MKSRALLTRAIALLIIASIFVIVFSALTFGTHCCDHGGFCSVCAYQSEHVRELFIPVLCACIAPLIAFAALFYFLSAGEGAFASFTPVKFKVKLSD